MNQSKLAGGEVNSCVYSALGSGSSGLGSSHGRGQCVVFLGKRIYTYDASSPPRCIQLFRERLSNKAVGDNAEKYYG